MSNGVGGLIVVGVEDEGNVPKSGRWPLFACCLGRSDQEEIFWNRVAGLVLPRSRADLYRGPRDGGDAHAALDGANRRA
jgi:hypothetical protein